MRDLHGFKAPLCFCQGWSMSLSKPACGVSLVSIKAVFNASRINDSLSLYLCPISCSISMNILWKEWRSRWHWTGYGSLWHQGFPYLEGSPKLALPYFQQYRGVPLEGLVALKLRIRPRAWSVLVSLLCSVLYKNNPDLQSPWGMSSASFSGNTALTTRDCSTAVPVGGAQGAWEVALHLFMCLFGLQSP